MYAVTTVQETCPVTLCANTFSWRLVSENVETSTAHYLLNYVSRGFLCVRRPLKKRSINILIARICGWSSLQLSERSRICTRSKDPQPLLNFWVPQRFGLGFDRNNITEYWDMLRQICFIVCIHPAADRRPDNSNTPAAPPSAVS